MTIHLLPCYCGAVRQASRAITQFYDTILQAADIRIMQFGLMKAIQTVQGIRTTDLAQTFGMDRTTLTRTLAALQKTGWITVQHTQDRRANHWHLTAKGEAKMAEALPLWERAQREAEKKFSANQLQQLSKSLHQLTVSLSS